MSSRNCRRGRNARLPSASARRLGYVIDAGFGEDALVLAHPGVGFVEASGDRVDLGGESFWAARDGCLFTQELDLLLDALELGLENLSRFGGAIEIFQAFLLQFQKRRLGLLETLWRLGRGGQLLLERS